MSQELKVPSGPLVRLGRRPKPIPADAAARITELSADGWSLEGIVWKLGVHRETLRGWLNEHPELQEAFDLGRAQEQHTLHNVVYRRAVEDTGKDGLLAAMYLLNCRHRYRTDRPEDSGNRVNVIINLPAARPLSDFIEIENADGTETHTISTARR